MELSRINYAVRTQFRQSTAEIVHQFRQLTAEIEHTPLHTPSDTNFGRQVPKLSTDMNLTFFTFSNFSPNFRRPYLLNRNSVFHQILTRCTWISILSSTKILWKTEVGKTIVRLSGQRCAWHAFQENRY